MKLKNNNSLFNEFVLVEKQFKNILENKEKELTDEIKKMIYHILFSISVPKYYIRNDIELNKSELTDLKGILSNAKLFLKELE